MKATRSIQALILTGFLALPALLHAQSTAVPGSISYQGRVVDANGVAVGTGTPVNRTVIFRIWDHPSNVLTGNLIYAEQQTVTISEGDFSALVGQGALVSSTTQFGYSESAKKLADLGTAFNGSTRYLGVTVDDGTATADTEITPRQQIVTTGFAFRSKVAESLSTSSGTPSLTSLDNGNVGIGNINPPARFTVTGASTTASTTPQMAVTDSADTSKRLRIGVDPAASGGLGSGFLQSFKEGAGVTNLLLNPNGGNVGIGKTNPASALDVNGTVTATQFNGSFNGTGGSITALNATNLSTGTVADVRLSTNVALLTGTQTFSGQKSFASSVGIGTATPLVPLHVNTAGTVTSLFDSTSVAGTWLDIRNTSVGGKNWQLVSSGSGNGEGPGKLLFIQSSTPGTAETIPLTLQPNGNIGISNASPTFPLSFANAFGGKISFGGHSNIPVKTHSISLFDDPSSTRDAIRIHTGEEQDSIEFGNLADNFVFNRTMYLENNTNSARLFLTGDAFKPGGGSWGTLSDRRLKKDIAPLAGALKKLDRLNPVTFQFIDPTMPGQGPGTHTGFIAQEVEKVFPEWISETKGGYKAISITGFESLTVQALRELRSQQAGEIDALKAQVSEKDQKIAALEKRLVAIESADQRLEARFSALEKSMAANAAEASGLHPVSVKRKTAAAE